MQSIIKEYENLMGEILGVSEDTEVEVQVTDTILIGLMLCKRLDKIGALLEFADSLVGIKESLCKLAELADCISKSQAGKQFCITGDVSSYGI